jgi:hypothetical protein
LSAYPATRARLAYKVNRASLAIEARGELLAFRAHKARRDLRVRPGLGGSLAFRGHQARLATCGLGNLALASWSRTCQERR